MNYRFSTSEIKLLQKFLKIFITSDRRLEASDEDLNCKISSYQSSLNSLLEEIIQYPESRDVLHEQSFFDSKYQFSDQYRSLLMVERIRLLYSTIGFPLPRLISIRQEKDLHKYLLLIIQWNHLYDLGVAEKFAKYQSVSFFNKWLEVEPLPLLNLKFGWLTGCLCPFGSIQRRLNRHLSRLKKDFDLKSKLILERESFEDFLEQLQSWLYFKKGCPKSSDKMVRQALVDHRLALSTDKGPLGDCPKVGVTREILEERIRLITNRVFANYRAPTQWWDPSNSASFSTSRKLGGQASEIVFPQLENYLEPFRGHLVSKPVGRQLRFTKWCRCYYEEMKLSQQSAFNDHLGPQCYQFESHFGDHFKHSCKEFVYDEQSPLARSPSKLIEPSFGGDWTFFDNGVTVVKVPTVDLHPVLDLGNHGLSKQSLEMILSDGYFLPFELEFDAPESRYVKTDKQAFYKVSPKYSLPEGGVEFLLGKIDRDSQESYRKMKRVKRLINAKPVALCEPLKVRVITCEDAWSTYILKGAQMSLWKCLKEYPWFSLTGRPCSPVDIPISDLPWISVDYKAATDNLHCDMSEMTIRHICNLTGLPYRLCLESLCSHELHYESGERKDLAADSVVQKNGQLMGSILSFIVLCIANAAIISLSLIDNNDSHRKIFEQNILVNGDDGLFCGTEENFNTWKILSSHVGLEPSVGKVYYSNSFCVINSQLFARPNGFVQECLYPNPSGMMQFDARTYSNPVGPLDLSEAHRLWVTGFRKYEDKVKAETLWYTTFDSILKADWVTAYSVSWHMPKALGGLGLPIRISTEIENSDFSIDSRFESSIRIPPRLGRPSLAFARYSIKYGPIWRYKDDVDQEKKGFYNPFSPKYSNILVSSKFEPGLNCEDGIRALGYDRPISYDRSLLKKVNPFDYFLPKRSCPSLSNLALSLLNGCSLTRATPIKSKLNLDLREVNKLFRKKGLMNNLWCLPYNHSGRIDLTCEDYIGYEICSVQQRMKSWDPKIPGNGLSIHYHDFLQEVDDSRSHTYFPTAE